MLVAVKVTRWLLPGRVSLQAASVYQENVRPAIAVKVEEGGAAAGRLDDVLLGFLPAGFRFNVQPGALGNVNKIDSRGLGRRVLRRRLPSWLLRIRESAGGEADKKQCFQP